MCLCVKVRKKKQSTRMHFCGKIEDQPKPGEDAISHRKEDVLIMCM